MESLSGFPYIPVRFDKGGSISDKTDADQVLASVEAANADDLIVISHGWNNDEVEASSLYKNFFSQVQSLKDRLPAGRKWAVLGIFWPSKKFGEQELADTPAKGVSSGVAEKALLDALDDLKQVFGKESGDAIEKAKGLVTSLQDSPAAQRDFVDEIRKLLTRAEGNKEDSPAQFFNTPGDNLIGRLDKPVLKTITQGKAGAGGALNVSETGSAQGILKTFGGKLGGALNFLNYATYYEMKERAGIVGARGVGPLLRDIRKRFPALRLHLVGHSFGARLLTAAVTGEEGADALEVDTLMLLQAAFSHYGFSDGYDANGTPGFFREVVSKQRVLGAIVITCTQNDLAVGRLYPLASMIAGQAGKELGDKNSLYGGMGANGAQKSAANEIAMQAVTGAYALKAGVIHNLNADAFILGHSDICKPEVAHALISATAIA